MAALRCLPRRHLQPWRRHLLHRLVVPARLLLENIQIISSFKKNLHVAWPAIFVSMMKKLQVLNFDIFSQPGSACAMPKPRLYDKFNAITLGLFGLMAYGLTVKLGGLLWMRYWRRASARAQVAYVRLAISRAVFVLTLAYAPTTEIVLSIFSCREIDGRWYLREDILTPCDDAEYYSYYRAGIVWTLMYPARGPPPTPAPGLRHPCAASRPRRARRLAQPCRLRRWASRRCISS